MPTPTTPAFNRDALAKKYADRTTKIDTAVVQAFHLPGGSAEREVRLLLVGDLSSRKRGDPNRSISGWTANAATRSP